MSAHAFLLGGAYLFLPSKVDLDFTERNLFWTKAKKFGFILLKAKIPKIMISFCKNRDNFCSWEQKCLKDIVGLKKSLSQAFGGENGMWGKEGLIVCSFTSGSLAEATATSHKTLCSCVQTSGCTDVYVLYFPGRGTSWTFRFWHPTASSKGEVCYLCFRF